MRTPQQEQRITILATSDLHGFVFAHDYITGAPTGYGMAKAASVVRRHRESGASVLMIDNGDLVQGSPLAYYAARIDAAAPNAVVAGMNALGCDAAVLGNHEFNYGLDFLRKCVGESKFPWLSANIVNVSDGEPAFGPPYIVRETEGGVRVGILGLTTAYIPHWEHENNIQGLSFLDPVEAALRWVPALRAEARADVVVVAYHGGFERDIESGEPTEALTGENQGYELIERVPGIDVLIAGHQHRRQSGKRNGVPFVQPGYRGECAGKVELRLARHEDGWRIVSAEPSLLSLEEAPEDAGVVGAASGQEAKAQTWLDRPIGTVEGDMRIIDPMGVRLREHPMIEFINRVQMEASGAGISGTALFDNQSKGFPNQITMRDIITNYVYPNTLQVLRISGRAIRAALERSAEYFQLDEQGEIGIRKSFLEPKPQHYNYDMWEGIAYTLDVSRPVGERVVELTMNGKPLDEDAGYEVVMNNYRAGGGGEYGMFRGKPVVRDIPVDMVELLTDYVLRHPVIRAEVNGNWRVVVGADTPSK